MAKCIAINHIRVQLDGTIQVIFNKLSSDGDALGNHMIVLPPGVVVNDQLAWLEKDGNLQGYDLTISLADLAKINAQATAAWTAEVVAAYQAAQAAAEAARNSA